MARQSRAELKRSKYRLLGLIGQGQFGQVFCAIHRQTGRLVALKNLEQERFPTNKFLRELRFLLSLQHPNIVTCQALEHTSTGRYLVMDYCEGGTLRNLMPEESRLSLPYSLKIVADVLAGLEHAHNRGIIHCDIKPENILMHVQSNSWMARISDFGIARLMQEMVFQEGDTGSPAYMAPERFYGRYSAASDLYSVGILLFELITGYRPFSGTPAELMSAHLNKPLQLPDTIPIALQPLITQALQKLPARRFRSAAEMLTAIKTIAATEQSLAWNQPSANQAPLFFTVVAASECPFQVVGQERLSQPITALATRSFSEQTTESERNASDLTVIYRASDRSLYQQIYPTDSLSAADPRIETIDPLQVTSPIEQLLIRPQGCFVVMQQAIGLLPHDSAPNCQLERQTSELRILATKENNSRVAIDPAGRWLAVLSASTNQDGYLAFYKVGQRGLAVAQPIPINQLGAGIHSSLFALDSRHLAIVTPQPASTETMIRVITRRGSGVGVLPLSFWLQQVILTPRPYRLLATDDQPGTVLLIDLKPYRVRRLWVEISPQFLVAMEWGYILAEASGKMLFLDQEGRQIGTTLSPSPITVLTPIQQHKLLVATWESDIGYLFFLDLQTLGLDLVF